VIVKRYVKCTVRRTGPNTWAAVSDSSHVPEGVGSVVASAIDVKIYYDFIDAEFVVTSAITPDEALAVSGIVPGGSVGLLYTSIQFGKAGVLVNPDTITNPKANVWVMVELGLDDGT
jgi:hypothetical protein